MIVATAGCSSLGSLGSLFSEKPKIEANVNVGKNVKQDKSQIKIETGTTEQTADNISNDTAYTADTVNQITQDIPPYIIILLVLGFGWVIPKPLETYEATKFVLCDVVHSFIVLPIKGFFNLLKEIVQVFKSDK